MAKSINNNTKTLKAPQLIKTLHRVFYVNTVDNTKIFIHGVSIKQ